MEWKRLTRQQLVSVIMYNIITRVITPLPTARASSQPAAQNQNQRYHRLTDTESVFPPTPTPATNPTIWSLKYHKPLR